LMRKKEKIHATGLAGPYPTTNPRIQGLRYTTLESQTRPTFRLRNTQFWFQPVFIEISWRFWMNQCKKGRFLSNLTPHK
jgi:hypothetical protein